MSIWHAVPCCMTMTMLYRMEDRRVLKSPFFRSWEEGMARERDSVSGSGLQLTEPTEPTGFHGLRQQLQTQDSWRTTNSDYKQWLAVTCSDRQLNDLNDLNGELNLSGSCDSCASHISNKHTETSTCAHNEGNGLIQESCYQFCGRKLYWHLQGYQSPKASLGLRVSGGNALHITQKEENRLHLFPKGLSSCWLHTKFHSPAWEGVAGDARPLWILWYKCWFHRLLKDVESRSPSAIELGQVGISASTAKRSKWPRLGWFGCRNDRLTGWPSWASQFRLAVIQTLADNSIGWFWMYLSAGKDA